VLDKSRFYIVIITHQLLLFQFSFRN